MKKYIFICCSLIFGISALSQHTLTGVVLNKENKLPVPNASVMVAELRIGANTDDNGRFYFSNLPKEKLTLQISAVSFKTRIQSLQIQDSGNTTFFLQPSNNSLEEIIISGSSAKTLIKESPIPITVLSSTQWRQMASTNLVDAVAKLPGMSQITTGSILSKPVIRGLAFNRVITIHDGIRQEDNQWGEEHSLHIDEYSIDRYEIIRGAGSLMYGSDGLGGVVSVLSRKPIEEGTIRGDILTNYQTNNKLYGLSASVSGNKNSFQWMGRISYKNAANYSNPFDGKVYGSAFKEFNINGMLGITKKWGYSRLYIANFHQKVNVINGSRDNTGQFTKQSKLDDSTIINVAVPKEELNSRMIHPSNSQDLINTKIQLNNHFILRNASNISINMAYTQNQRKEYGSILRPFIPDLYFFLQTAFYDIRYNINSDKEWETTIGTNGMAQLLTNKGNSALYPNFNLFDNGIFFFSKKKINRWNISGGMRYDIRKINIEKLYIDSNGAFQTTPQNAKEIRFTGFNKAFLNITGSLGAVYKINDQLIAKINMARGFRAPSIPEIASNGEHAGTSRYEIGNRSQQSEISLQTDIGLTYENKNWYIDATIFSNTIQNYSYSEKIIKTNGKDSIINNVPVFKYVQEKARLWGIEAQIIFTPQYIKWLSITQSFSMVMASNLSAQNDSAKFLPFMPPPRWITQVRFSIPIIKSTLGNWFKNIYAQIESEYNQPQHRAMLIYNTETTTPSYGLVHVGFGADILRNKKTIFSIYCTANNIFNETYQSHQSRLKYLDKNVLTGRVGVYNMGRNISIKLFIPFTIKHNDLK